MTGESVLEGFKILKQDIFQTAKAVEKVMATYLPFDKGEDQPLFNAMAYASLTNGKKLRPYLLWLVAQLYKVPFDQAMQVASALEFVHCASLIHDDLPCMDNADLRRGQPSCHKQFREDIALLAGDSLLILPYEILQNEKTHKDPCVRLDLIRALTQASGVKGIMLGQTMDILSSENKTPSLDYTLKLSALKTGSLLAFCCEAAAILGGAEKSDQKTLHEFGLKLGTLYQLVDDILDVEGTASHLGKPINQDVENNKNTFVSILGLEGARKYKKDLSQELSFLLKKLNKPTDKVQEFSLFLTTRTS